MLKTLYTAAALLAVTASPVFAKPVSKTFTRDGETYSYTTIDKGDRVVIRGNTGSSERFELTVRGDEISGTCGGVPVRFTMANAQTKLSSAQLASN